MRRRTTRSLRLPVVIVFGIPALLLAMGLGWFAHEVLRPSSRELIADPVAMKAKTTRREQREFRDDRTQTLHSSPTAESNSFVVPVQPSTNPPAVAGIPPQEQLTEPLKVAPLGFPAEPRVEPPTGSSKDRLTVPLESPVGAGSTALAAPVAGNSFSAPRGKPTVLFQEIDIERAPKFSFAGSVMAQELHYQILSELRIETADGTGIRKVQQVVSDTKLIRADDLSRESFAQSLLDLKGWQFSYKVDSQGDVAELKSSPPAGRKAFAVEPPGSKGFLLTSVMDPDGWREIAELCFFVPPEPRTGKSSWTRRMSHDYGPLGSWYGETRFQSVGKRDGLMRFDFVHQMTYSPPKKGAGDLPFAISSITFRPEIAGGFVEFDEYARRVRFAQERFVVKGAVGTELLGEVAGVEIEEAQSIAVRLLEHNPWAK